MKIRRFSLKDLDEVFEIEKASFKFPYNALVFIYYRFRCPDGFLVAEYGGKIVGYAIAYSSFRSWKKEGKLVSISVDPKHRTKGIGSRLLVEATKYLKKAGMRRMSLEVRESNNVAINFYKKFGFQIDQTISQYYQNGEDAIEMSKDLENG